MASSARRFGREDSETRAVLLDVAERVMREEGYAARCFRDGGQIVSANYIDTVAANGFGNRIEVGIVNQRNLLDAYRDLAHWNETLPFK